MAVQDPLDPPSIPITLPGPGSAHHHAICIDTTTTMAGLALIEAGQVVGELSWRVGRAHTESLALRLQGLASASGYEIRRTTIVCVCTGPGSFNGIRTGMATAFGLATGLGVSVYGSSSLDLLAFPNADRAPAQRAVLPAGRGTYYSALFGSRGGRWHRLAPYSIADLETLVAASPPKCLWCGALEQDDAARLAELLGGARRLVPPAHNVRRASYLLPLALAAAAVGRQGSPDLVEPLYLRQPAITTPRAASASGS